MLDIVKELKKTLHLHSDELPYINVTNTGEMRFLGARVDENFYISQFRGQPGYVSELHMHGAGGGNYGFTLKGRWGHDNQCLYRPGTVVYETPGVIHRFVNGPDEETEILFFGPHDVDFVDPKTLEVTGSVTGRDSFNKYLELCEERGVKPRFLA